MSAGGFDSKCPISEPGGNRFYRIQNQRLIFIYDAVKVRGSHGADAKPIIFHLRIIPQDQCYLMMAGSAQVKHMLDIHIPGTQISPIDSFFNNAVHLDFQVSGLGR